MKTKLEKNIIKLASPDLYAMDIAVKLNISVQSVYRAKRKFNLNLKQFKPQLSPEQQERCNELASPLIGVKKIATTINAPCYQVKAYLDGNNLPRKRMDEPKEPVKSGKDVFCWEDYEHGVY